MEKYCDKLNSLLPANDNSINEINGIINEVRCKGGELYCNRQIYIDCGFDWDKIHNLIYTDKVKFVPSDDVEEHPGIVIVYKNK